MQQIYQERTYGVSAFLVRTSALLENRKELQMVNNQVYSSQLQDLLDSSKKKIDPSCYSLKTLKTYLVSIKGGILPNCKLSWMKSGMTVSGTFSTQKKSCLNTGNVSSLSDILEDEVPEKYFLSQDKADKLPAHRHGIAINDGIVPKEEFGRLGRQAAETMNTHGAKDGDIIEPFNYRVHKNGITPTITTRPEGLKTAILPVTNNLRIRKLTPRECWRLQGFPDLAFDKAKEAGVSDSQLYKQAGNSVTVPVIYEIAKRLVIESGD